MSRHGLHDATRNEGQKIRREPGKPMVDGKSFRLANEVRYI
jgi:hypothetical protein